MKTSTLKDQLERWRQDRMAFRREAILLEDGRPLGEAMEPWQAEDFAALDDPQYRHAYLERPRGHDKTGAAGDEVIVTLYLGRPGSEIIAVAADHDQANLLRADVEAKIRRNPILARSAQFKKNEIVIRATSSKLRVLASDAPSAYGLRPDLIVCDEIAEWKKRDLWDALWSSTGKRRNCRMIVIGTAGWDQTSIAAEVRELARQEEDWYFSSRGQCASWIDKKWLAQQERTLPRHVYARLHLNQWLEGSGAFFLGAEVDGVFAGPLPDSRGAIGRVISADLALVGDAAVISKLAVHPGRIVAVEAFTTWTPRAGVKVDLQAIEEVLAEYATQSGGVPIVLDPWQGAQMAQRLRAQGHLVHEFKFTAESRRKLFSTLADLIRTRKLRAAPHDDLRRELLGLEVHETTGGWRVDHRSGKHDDHVIAVAMGAALLTEAANQPIVDPTPTPDELAFLRHWARLHDPRPAPLYGDPFAGAAPSYSDHAARLEANWGARRLAPDFHTGVEDYGAHVDRLLREKGF